MEPHVKHILLALSTIALTACGGTAIFEAVGNNMSNPLTVALDTANDRAYVVNSNDQYNYTGGSIHSVDISDLTNPTRLDVVAIDSFGGQAFLDTTAQTLVVPNRFSDNDDVTSDRLLSMSVAGGDFGAITETVTNLDPFGTIVNAAGTRLYVPTGDDSLQVIDISGATPEVAATIDLLVELDDGSTLRAASVARGVLFNNETQLVLVREEGGLFVLNVSELENSAVNAVDYFIDDIVDPRSVAIGDAASKTIYVSELLTNKDGTQSDLLRELNLTRLPAVSDNTTTAVKDKDVERLLKDTIFLGVTSRESDDPQEVVVSTDFDRTYISLMESGYVSVVKTSTGKQIKTIQVGEEPFGLALYQATDAEDTHLFVCNRVGNTVSIIDLSTNTIVGTYP